MVRIRGHRRTGAVGSWDLEVGPLPSSLKKTSHEINKLDDSFVRDGFEGTKDPKKMIFPRIRDNQGGILHELAMSDQTEAVKNALRLSYGSINKQDVISGNTLLHIAAMRGNKTLVSFLLEMGAGVDIENGQGLRARKLAEMSGQGDLAELIARYEVG